MAGKYIWDVQIQKDKEEHLKTQKEIKMREQIAREQEKEEERIRKRKEIARKKKEEIISKRKRDQKRKKIIRLSIFIIVIAIIFFTCTYPFIPLENVSIANSNYYDKNQLVIQKEKYNLIDIFKVDLMIPKENNLITRDTVDIDIKEKKVTFNVTERSILGYNESGKLLYESNNAIYEIVSEVKAPLIIGLDEQEEVNLAKELEDIDYSIYDQIVSIQKTSDSENEVITMYMEDGNVIYINIDDVSEKLKYYDQIKSIIDEKGSGAGYIHLDIGDYYEPKQ